MTAISPTATSTAPSAEAPFGRIVTAMVTPFAPDGSVNLDLAARLAAIAKGA